MIGISTKDNNSSDDNSVSSLDDIEGDFTYTATPTSIIDDLSLHQVLLRNVYNAVTRDAAMTLNVPTIVILI